MCIENQVSKIYYNPVLPYFFSQLDDIVIMGSVLGKHAINVTDVTDVTDVTTDSNITRKLRFSAIYRKGRHVLLYYS